MFFVVEHWPAQLQRDLREAPTAFDRVLILERRIAHFIETGE
jgi:hypothetical protein